MGETPTSKERAPSESEEAPKRKERTHRSKVPEETKKHLDMQAAPERKRSSLDNEFVVPVKVETKVFETKAFETRANPLTRNQTKDHEQESADISQKFGEEATARNRSRIVKEEEKRSSSDGVRESDVKVKVEGGHEVIQTTPLSSEWKVNETRVHRTEEVRRTEERRTLVIQSDGSTANNENLQQKRGDVSPRRRTPNDDFDLQLSGLTPVKARTIGEPHVQGRPVGAPNDVSITSQHSVTTSYRSTTHEVTGIEKPSSPTKLEPSTGVKPEATMAIFDALKGLKSQKGDPQKSAQQVMDPPSSAAAASAVADRLSSSVEHSSPPAVSPTPSATPSAAVTPRTTDGLSHSPPDRPIPAVRKTIIQQTHPATGKHLREGIILCKTLIFILEYIHKSCIKRQ